MIGKIRGKLDLVADDKVILDVNGVGYNIYISSKLAESLRSKLGQELALIIETIVREDHIHLYGFSSESERSWFNQLCKVKGVGNKLSLKILSALSLEDLVLAIASADKALIAKTPGVGPKLALRIVLELKDSLNKLSVLGGFAPESHNQTASNKKPIARQDIIDDALTALEQLGYKKAESYKIITLLATQNPDITLEHLITSALREVGKNKFNN